MSASGPDVAPTAAGCTSFAVLAVGNRLHEFTAGDARFSRDQAMSLNVAEKAAYRMHAGLVRIGTGEQRSPEGTVDIYTHVAWEGRDHSLGTVMYQGDTAPALALLDAIEIQEHTNGIVLRPRDARISIVQGSQHAPGVYIPVRGEGLLHAARVSRFWDQQRPAWEGKHGRGGQLYAEEHPMGDPPTILLFGQRAVTRIYLNDRNNGLASRAAELAVDWVSQ